MLRGSRRGKSMGGAQTRGGKRRGELDLLAAQLAPALAERPGGYEAYEEALGAARVRLAAPGFAVLLARRLRRAVTDPRLLPSRKFRALLFAKDLMSGGDNKLIIAVGSELLPTLEEIAADLRPEHRLPCPDYNPLERVFARDFRALTRECLHRWRGIGGVFDAEYRAVHARLEARGALRDVDGAALRLYDLPLRPQTLCADLLEQLLDVPSRTAAARDELRRCLAAGEALPARNDKLRERLRRLQDALAGPCDEGELWASLKELFHGDLKVAARVDERVRQKALQLERKTKTSLLVPCPAKRTLSIENLKVIARQRTATSVSALPDPSEDSATEHSRSISCSAETPNSPHLPWTARADKDAASLPPTSDRTLVRSDFPRASTPSLAPRNRLAGSFSPCLAFKRPTALPLPTSGNSFVDGLHTHMRQALRRREAA